MIGEVSPVRRAAQRFVLVIGAGALGAAVCSTGVRYTGPDDDETLRALRASNSPSPSARPVGSTEAEALRLLRRAAAAESDTTYEGRKLYGSWSDSGSESVLAEVEHVAGRGTWLRVTTASGQVARGDAGRKEIADGDGDLDQQALTLLTDQYTLRIAESSRCLGRDVTVVEATPLGAEQVAGRFWIDDASGLLLRRELYDSRGRTVRATAFLDIELTTAATALSRAQAASVTKRRPGVRNQRALDEAALDRLGDDGWVLPHVLPAGMVLYRARSVETSHGGEAVQLTYSDGLFALSLFAQRGRLDTSALRGFHASEFGETVVHSRPGLYRQVVFASGDTVYTLVTDLPDAELQQIVAALPHAEPSSSLRSRVGRGIDRMGSWINPFE